MPADRTIRSAVAKDIQQYFTQCLTPNRGYAVPIDHVKALIVKLSKKTK